MAFLQFKKDVQVTWASPYGVETRQHHKAGERLAGHVDVGEKTYYVSRVNGDSANIPRWAAEPVFREAPAVRLPHAPPAPIPLRLSIFEPNVMNGTDILQVQQAGNLFDVLKCQDDEPTKGLHINELLMLIRLTFGPLSPDNADPTLCLSLAAAAAGAAAKAIGQSAGIATSRLVFRGDGGKIEFTLTTGESYEMPLIRVLGKSDGQTQSSPGNSPPRH